MEPKSTNNKYYVKVAHLIDQVKGWRPFFCRIETEQSKKDVIYVPIQEWISSNKETFVLSRVAYSKEKVKIWTSDPMFAYSVGKDLFVVHDSNKDVRAIIQLGAYIYGSNDIDVTIIKTNGFHTSFGGYLKSVDFLLERVAKELDPLMETKERKNVHLLEVVLSTTSKKEERTIYEDMESFAKLLLYIKKNLTCNKCERLLYASHLGVPTNWNSNPEYPFNYSPDPEVYFQQRLNKPTVLFLSYLAERKIPILDWASKSLSVKITPQRMEDCCQIFNTIIECICFGYEEVPASKDKQSGLISFHSEKDKIWSDSETWWLNLGEEQKLEMLGKAQGMVNQKLETGSRKKVVMYSTGNYQ